MNVMSWSDDGGENSGFVNLDAYVRSTFFGKAAMVDHVTQAVAGSLYAFSSVRGETLNFIAMLSQLLFVVAKNLFLGCSFSQVGGHTEAFWFAAQRERSEVFYLLTPVVWELS